MLLPLWSRREQIFFYRSLKLIEYSASTVNVESSNPRVGPLLRIDISFFQLSVCTEELLSNRNIMTVLQSPLPSVNEKNPRASNPIPYPK